VFGTVGSLSPFGRRASSLGNLNAFAPNVFARADLLILREVRGQRALKRGLRSSGAKTW
jgi:hypothetical protein